MLKKFKLKTLNIATCYLRKIKIRVCYYTSALIKCTGWSFASVLSCVRGFHVYGEHWTAFVGEELTCQWERGNVVDRYAVAVKKATDIYCKLTQFSSLTWRINMWLLSYSLRAGTSWIQRRTYLTIGRLNRSRGDSIREWPLDLEVTWRTSL